MGKIIILSLVLYSQLFAKKTSVEVENLHKNCLECHIQEQIPTPLIYRRYLMKYSTKEEMQKAIFRYMKNPLKENSIMPPPFFYKFPMKGAIEMDDETLHRHISTFLDYMDVKKRLVLP